MHLKLNLRLQIITVATMKVLGFVLEDVTSLMNVVFVLNWQLRI